MKRLFVAALIMAAFTTAQAASPHFISATGSLNTRNGNYTATWKEAGLGSNALITYVLAADGNFVFQCYTKSNNQPQGAPQAGGTGHISTPGTFPSGKNGSITGSLTLEPELGTAACQGGGLKLCLTSVSYTNVTLTDDTNTGVPVQYLPPATQDFSANPICGF